MNLQMIKQSPLVLGAGELWPQATSGEFLSAIRDGNLPSEAFQRWLVQDYAFVKGLAAFQAIAVLVLDMGRINRCYTHPFGNRAEI